MPNTRSAKKALRQDEKRRKINDRFRKQYKEAVKAVQKGIEAGEKDLTEKVQKAQKALDKAARRKAIKKQKASRLLSRLAKKVQKTTTK